jgi:hypothetical protein
MENIMLSETSQAQKNKYGSHLQGEDKKLISKSNGFQGPQGVREDSNCI